MGDNIMHFVTSVEYESGFKLRLHFEDDSVKIVDLESYLEGEMFEPLRDLKLFCTAHLNRDVDTVVWDNGADMSPDFLYEIGTSARTSPVSKVAEDTATYGGDSTPSR